MNLKSEYSNQLGPIDLSSIPVNCHQSGLIGGDLDFSLIPINRFLLVDLYQLID